MQDRNRKVYSIDGFEPRKAASRTIGFDAVKRPEDRQYPGVGMTLASYTPSNSPTVDGNYQLPAPVTPPVAQERPVKRKWRPSLTKRKITLIIILLLLIPVGWLGFKLVHNLSKVFHGNVLSVLTTTKLLGEDTGRVNILLAGNSADDYLHQGAELTDSIMILSIDTKHNNAFMMSVPRDLWVEIPNYGHAKINEAYVDGENEHFNQSGYFPGGMGLLQQTIQDNFGVDLNYYALINYNAFRDMVNAVGGIDVNVQSTDKRGLYDPSIDYTTHGPLVKLTNGVHTLNGQQALDLARARGDAYGSYGFPQSDFDRTMHQRQELLSLREKSTSTGVLTNPVKLSTLLDAVGNNVRTDFRLDEVKRLYQLTKDMPANSIQSLSLNDAHGKNLLSNYQTPAGASALTPAAGVDDFSDIQQFIKQITSTNPITREGATVVVLNATDTSGLAGSIRTTLKAKGVNVDSIGDADANQAVSSIVDLSNGKFPATKTLLQQLYGQTVVTTSPYSRLYTADFIVLVGADKVPKPSTTSTGTTTTGQ